MQYFDTSSIPENCSNQLVYLIDQEINKARTNEQWRKDYMTYVQKMQDCIAIGKEEGIDISITKTINICLNHNLEKETIIKDLMDEFSISKDEAEKHFAKAVEQN